MDLFNLKAKVTLDTDDYEQGINQARATTTSFMDVFKGNMLSNLATGAISKIGGAITSALSKGVGAVKNFVSESVSAFSEFEQLSGGVETLFGNASRSASDYANDITQTVAEANEKLGAYAAKYGEDFMDVWADDLYEQKLAQVGKMTAKQKDEFFEETYAEYQKYIDYVGLSEEQITAKAEKEYADRMAAQDLVMQNAKNAWKTAGVSMNEYMNTVTGFSASLAQSLDNDMLKTAEYSDRALQDMSDNANKMGSQMGSIMNAYMGFSKQNYTMLDNLKLGYGGTKSEMERLIKDASKMTAIQKELNLTVEEGDTSFGNIVNAISVVQKKLDITGTTAKEAATTIQGATSATKAAWENVKIAFSTGEGLEDAFDNLMEAIFGDGETTGLINQVLPRITKVFESIGKYLPQIMSKLADYLPALLDALKPVLEAIKNAIVSILNSEEFKDAMRRIGESLMQALKEGLDAVGLGGLGDAIQWLWDNRETIVKIGEILLAAFAGSKLINGVKSVADGLKTVGTSLFGKGGDGEGTGTGTGTGGGLLKTLGTDVSQVSTGAKVGGVASGLFIGTAVGSAVSNELYQRGFYGEDSGNVVADFESKSGVGKWLDIFEYIQKGIEDATVGAEMTIRSYNNKTKHALEEGYSSWEEYRAAMLEKYEQMNADGAKHAEEVEKNGDRLFKAVNNSLPIPSQVADKWEELKTIAQDGSAYIADTTKSNLAGIPSDVIEMQEGITSTVNYGVDDVVSSLERLRAATDDSFHSISDVADATTSDLAGVPSSVLDAMTGASSAVNYGVDDMVSSLERLRKAASRAASSIYDIADASASSLAGVPSDVLDKMGARHYASAVDNPVIFDHPEYAMVGDGTEPEVLMGISTFRAMLEQAQSAIQAQVNINPQNGATVQQGQERQIIIPVYIGDEKLDEIVVDSVRRQAYLTGGR